MAELLSMVAPDSYISRTSIHTPKHIILTKKAIRQAFLAQIQDQGFGLVEVLAACPTNWRLDPASCMEKINSEIIPHFPLKTFSSPKKED
jgi:2-oxoglutarate ferredoxin oxidoreductase subunit beta